MKVISKKTIATMKNLFKNLMLVAVAAMAFTACTKTNDEVNAVSKKTIITGVASLGDDTRSGFVGSETIENEDGTTTTVYKSAWDGSENIKIFTENGLTTTTTIDTDGKFSAEFEGELPESFFITICSPAEAWVSTYTWNIPQTQTPLVNTVDPAAHILQKQNVYVTNGTAESFKIEHQVAYGKMTINTPDDFVIDHVDIKLNGDWYGYAKNLSYTINADNVEDNTFWFATDTIDVADFTVTAYNAEGEAYTKSVTIPEGRTLSFSYGVVTKFSVSNLKEYEAPVGPMFTSAETSSYGNDKYIYFYSDDNSLSTLKVNAYDCFSGDNWDIWNEGTYSETYVTGVGMIYTGTYTTYGDEHTKSINVTVSHVEEGYKVVFKNVTDLNDNIMLEAATYVGPIAGLTTPDLRTQLATPVVETSIEGKTLTLSWEAIENAENYYIECTSSNDIAPISTTETTVTITLPSYDYYSFYVQAVVSEDNTLYRSSKRTYIEYYDPREELAAPENITATVNGPSVTVSWDAVDGADGYQVYYYLNGEQRIDVDETTITLNLGYDQNNVWIYVFSVANDDNNTYRSSTSYDARVEVNTDVDPNVTADYEATNIRWNNDEERFEFICDDLQYFHIKMNAADRPGNNSFAVGEYTGVGSRYTGEKQFAVSQKANSGYAVGWTDTSNASNMSISVVDGQYLIYIEYVALYNQGAYTLMYKGIPDGFVLPDGSGGSQPETPTHETITLTSLSKGSYFDTIYVYEFTFKGDNTEFTLGWSDYVAKESSIEAKTYDFYSTYSQVGNYNSYFGQKYATSKFNGVNSTISSGTVTVSNEGNTYTFVMNLTLANGTTVDATYTGEIGTTSTEPENPGEGGGEEPENPGEGEEWVGREIRLNLLGYMDNALYTNANNESLYFMTSFRNGIVAGKFNLAGSNKSTEIMLAGHATSQAGLFGGTTAFNAGDTVEVIENSDNTYTITYRVTVNGEKITATYTGKIE